MNHYPQKRSNRLGKYRPSSITDSFHDPTLVHYYSPSKPVRGTSIGHSWFKLPLQSDVSPGCICLTWTTHWKTLIGSFCQWVTEFPPYTIPYKYKPNYFNTLAYTIYIVTRGKKKIKIPSRKEKSLSQISYVIIMQKIILVSLCMYAKNNLIPRICFYPEVGISKRKSWQFSAERSEEKLETDPSPSYQLVGLLLGVSAAACYIRNRKTKRGLKSNKPYMNQGTKKERIFTGNTPPLPTDRSSIPMCSCVVHSRIRGLY